MKKFSTVNNIKVNKEPKSVEPKKNKTDDFSNNVQYLMDQFLTIQTYGPIDRYQRAGNIKIKGKELFLEALLKLIETNKGKDSISILESLKADSKDWESIDKKIDSLKQKSFDPIEESEAIKTKNGVSKLLEKYNDKDICLLSIKNYVSNLNVKESLEKKYLACLKLKQEGRFTNVIDQVIEIYKNKINNL
jgi:hypothetical protein